MEAPGPAPQQWMAGIDRQRVDVTLHRPRQDPAQVLDHRIRPIEQPGCGLRTPPQRLVRRCAARVVYGCHGLGQRRQKAFQGAVPGRAIDLVGSDEGVVVVQPVMTGIAGEPPAQTAARPHELVVGARPLHVRQGDQGALVVAPVDGELGVVQGQVRVAGRQLHGPAERRLRLLEHAGRGLAFRQRAEQHRVLRDHVGARFELTQRLTAESGVGQPLAPRDQEIRTVGMLGQSLTKRRTVGSRCFHLPKQLAELSVGTRVGGVARERRSVAGYRPIHLSLVGGSVGARHQQLHGIGAAFQGSIEAAARLVRPAQHPQGLPQARQRVAVVRSQDQRPTEAALRRLELAHTPMTLAQRGPRRHVLWVQLHGLLQGLYAFPITALGCQ